MTKSRVSVAAVGNHVGQNPVLQGIAADWSCLVRDGAVLATPGGKSIAHAEKRLIEAIAKEATSRKGLQLASLTLYSMFCTMKDGVEKERGNKAVSCRYLLLGEASLRTCAGPEVADQLAMLGPLQEYFERNKLPRLLLGQAGDGKHQEDNLLYAGLGKEVDQLVAFFDGRLADITPAQRCVVTNCVHLHGVFVLGVLLAESVCTPEQYGDGLLAVNCCIPGVFGGVTKRAALRAKTGAVKDAELMLRFRDLADTSAIRPAGGDDLSRPVATARSAAL